MDTELTVPPDPDDLGWIGWLHGCCHLPVWQCPRGVVHPIEARFCAVHGCARPPRDRVVHEVHPPAQAHHLRAVSLALSHQPAHDGRSTPALAGNVLVYLTDTGNVVAADFGRMRRVERQITLMGGVRAATLHVRRGQVIGAALTEDGFRYVGFDVVRLRAALVGEGMPPEARPIDERLVHLRTLPTTRARVDHGSGVLRLAVEHDPVRGKAARIYQAVVGREPGPFLIRRSSLGAAGRVDIRPQRLLQVPVAVPGGTFLLGRVRWQGAVVQGAVLVPTVGVPRG